MYVNWKLKRKFDSLGYQICRWNLLGFQKENQTYKRKGEKKVEVLAGDGVEKEEDRVSIVQQRVSRKLLLGIQRSLPSMLSPPGPCQR